MLSYLHVVQPSAERLRAAADEIARAVAQVREAYSQGRVTQEPHLTDRLLGAIETRMEGYEVSGLRWSAKTLSDRGKGSEEKRYGADFVGVLNVALPSYEISKGFLAQAKLLEPDEYLTKDEWDVLVRQCARMLELSPASFVFLYSTAGVRVVPAHSVTAIGAQAPEERTPYGLYSRSLRTFFMHHFESFIGDSRIVKPHAITLEELAREAGSTRGIALALSEIPA